MNIKKHVKQSLYLLLALFIVGCGGGGGGGSSESSTVSSSSSSASFSGSFLDDLIVGLKYTCSSGNIGITDNAGIFTCQTNDIVKFYIDSMFLGEITLAQNNQVVTPYDLSTNDSISVLMAQTFQTIGREDIINGKSVLVLDVLPLDDSLPSSISDIDFLSKFSNFLANNGKTIVNENVAKDKMDLNIVQEIANSLTFNDIKGLNNSQDSISHNLNLITTFNHGTSIEWSSDNSSVITNTGTITRSNSLSNDTQDVTLMATITKGNGSATTNISLKVFPFQEVPLLTVLVNFSNYNINSSDATWTNKMYGMNKGGLNHYFNEVSYGKFKFVPVNENYGTVNDGIIKVSLSQNHIGHGDANDHYDAVISDATALSDSYIDYSLYDTNGDNKISDDELQIIFVFAGEESSYNGNKSSGIWAHKSYILDDKIQTLDGITILGKDSGGYSAFGERHGSHDATIGIIAHELGHAAFDLPDLYDVDKSSNGIGYFGLMGAGSWANLRNEFDGATPTHLSAYSKIKINFTKATVLTNSKDNVKLYGSSENTFNIIKIPTVNNNEYYLLENRESKGYDAGLYWLDGISYSQDFQGGLAIWHINEANLSNANENNKLVDLEEANYFGLDNNINKGHEGNLYYFGNKTTFDDLSTPNTRLYDGSSTNISINNISSRSSTMQVNITK